MFGAPSLVSSSVSIRFYILQNELGQKRYKRAYTAPSLAVRHDGRHAARRHLKARPHDDVPHV
jgi:hypothetical protein